MPRGSSSALKGSAPPASHDDDSAASSAFSLGLPCQCDISSQYGSDRHLCLASAAVSTHPYGSLGLSKITPKCRLTQAQYPISACAKTRVACHEAAGTWLATTTARNLQQSLSLSLSLPTPLAPPIQYNPIPRLSLVLDIVTGFLMGQ